MILFLKLNLDNWRRASVKIASVFFFMSEQKVHVKVAESQNEAQLQQVQEWKTAFDRGSRDKYVKKGLHEIIENQIKKAATKCSRGKPGFKSIEWSPVLLSVFFSSQRWNAVHLVFELEVNN